MPANLGSQVLNTFTKDLGPWVPDIDPRRNNGASILGGRNFQDTIDGPASAWSSNIINFNYWQEPSRKKITELKITNDILYGANDGVWKINKVSQVAELIISVTVTETYWPWSIAYVGGVYYIAQYNVGLWRFDPADNSVIKVTTPFGDNVSYVAESAGRLIYISPDYVGVSAQDDGTDLTPSLTTAAQAQPISLVGGLGLRIDVILDGFLVYTTNGIMKGTFTQAAFVFRFDVLKSGVRLFSPNAATYIPKLGSVSLDNSGLSLTAEGDRGSVPWEPVMGDFIHRNYIHKSDQTKYGNIQLYWSDAEQKLFVSICSSPLEGIMDKCFVWSAVTKRWSPFDHTNTGIFETYTPSDNLYICGYMGIDGYMRQFSNTNYSQGLPDDGYTINDLLYRAPNETEILTVEISSTVIQVATTEILGSDANPIAYKNFTNSTGLYEINSEVFSDTNLNSQLDPDTVIDDPILIGSYIDVYVSGVVELFAVVYSLPAIDIESQLIIGPYRYSAQTDADETSMVSNLILGMPPVANFIVSEDWNNDGVSEDWNVLSGQEDWGSGNFTPNLFSLTLRSTNDGINPPLQGDEALEVFNDLGSALAYNPLGYSGIWHILILETVNPYDSFALKTADFTGMLTGKL